MRKVQLHERGIIRLAAIRHKYNLFCIMNDKSYEDIINLPHHVSKRHPQMSMHQRAAQFAPFAALGALTPDERRDSKKRVESNE